jgi:predicted nucleotidyltransferase
MGFIYKGGKADEVHETVRKTCETFKRHIGQNLKGLYLHGSLAMGCFRPWTSDIDLLAVVFEPMAREAKLGLVWDIMAIAEGGQEFRSVEFSVVTAEEAVRAKHPIRYILHYSNGWHQAYKEGRADLVIDGGCDEDLAAHFTVLRRRGITLSGVPIAAAIGKVPREDYLRAVWYDIKDSESNIAGKPVYTVLNLCRTLMALETGFVGSKLEGGLWAAERPELAQWAPVIVEAANEYKTGIAGLYDSEGLPGFVRFMMKEIITRLPESLL